MTTLILGRTGSGKDTLREILQKDYGWQFVQSYTTRPQRSAEDARSHIFVTQREADKIRDRIAYTKINGYEYFSTKDQVDAADGYIIDVDGVRVLLENDPDEYFQIVYIRPGSSETQRELSISRAADPENEARVFESRAKSESPQFDAFEASLDAKEPAFPEYSNYEIIQFVNTYEEKDIRQLAKDLEGHRHFRRNAEIALRALMSSGEMNHTDDMRPVMAMPDGTSVPISVDMLCGYFREHTDVLGDMLYRWMALPSTELPDPDAHE